MIECTICRYKFNLNGEGGIQGFFGIIPVSFCSTCCSCIIDCSTSLVKVENKKKLGVK
jgi:NAD-dependent dihydropyrimidine dehydrogenase PreA subunit